MSDLRLVYISVVPLATMTQAPGFCWVCAHCQRELVTIGAKFTTNVGWRAAEITPSLCDREGAYADLRLVYISMVPLATVTQGVNI
ncbi:hypothetical protein [Salinivibrio kushneri]|uniref:hypothetical protein n=1 Tax=Salinivibrio kushneri TaxID=1908198 RepID=UPI0015E0CB33|nr:hypothetical protein [Salinivibrio kushneri]